MKTAKTNREEVRANTITVPMTKMEKEAVVREANKTGVSMSAWVRMVLNNALNNRG